MAASTVGARAQAMRKAKHGKGKLRAVRIEPAANGGHVVSHEMDTGDGPYQPDQKHAFTNTPDMLAHVGGLFGGKMSEGSPAEEKGESAAAEKAEKGK